MKDATPDLIYFANYRVEHIPDQKYKFKLVHPGLNRNKDLLVEAFIDEESQKVEWENMPLAIQMALGMFKFFDLKRHPYQCIVLAIKLIKDEGEPLRSREEIEQVLQGTQSSTR